MLRSATLSLPELALVGGTRALLGVGIALLLADRGDREQRRAVGWTLMAVGLATTVPLALDIFLSGQTARPKEEPPASRPRARRRSEPPRGSAG